MKILVTSDVHGKSYRLDEVIKKHTDITHHIDAGDLCLDANTLKKYHIITVKGNNDFYSDIPFERIIEIDGFKILLTHGHKDHVKLSVDKLIEKSMLFNIDLCVFGHTHQRYLNQHNRTLCINPGALGDFGKSYAIYENGQVTFYELI